MRLLNVHSLKLKEFFENQLPKYAILSHTWGNEEILFQDLAANPSRKVGYAKVNGTCELAAKQGYEWVWIDTCCIEQR